MATGPFSPLLVEGRSQQTCSFAASSPGWLITEPRGKEKCQECGCPSLLAGTALITASLVGLNEDIQDSQMDLVMSMI